MGVDALQVAQDIEPPGARLRRFRLPEMDVGEMGLRCRRLDVAEGGLLGHQQPGAAHVFGHEDRRPGAQVWRPAAQ